MCTSGWLDGTLRVPKTAGDLDITADIRAQQLTIAIDVHAPQDRGARARVSWLANQLKDAPGSLVIESYAKNARTPIVAALSQIIDDKTVLLDDQKREPNKFRVIGRSGMGASRKAGGKTVGFIDSVLSLVDDFYQTVVQSISPWQAPAPKLKPSVSVAEVTPLAWREDPEVDRAAQTQAMDD
jgi:hypothetical protein